MVAVVENISLVNFTLLTRMFKGSEEGLTVFETTHLTRDLIHKPGSGYLLADDGPWLKYPA